MSPREALAARQAALLAALVSGGAAPPGFDPARVAVEAAALRAKRRRVLGRFVRELLDAEGTPEPPELDDHLDRWIVGHPRRSGTGFHDDARAVVAALRRERALPRRRWWRPA